MKALKMWKCAENQKGIKTFEKGVKQKIKYYENQIKRL